METLGLFKSNPDNYILVAVVLMGIAGMVGIMHLVEWKVRSPRQRVQTPFTWWWPSTLNGKTVFVFIIAASSLTLFAYGPFAIVNVGFWYLVAVGVRFVFCKANGIGPRPSSGS